MIPASGFLNARWPRILTAFFIVECVSVSSSISKIWAIVARVGWIVVAYRPMDDHISSLASRRRITSSVNSEVVRWPPRSVVALPSCTASFTDS